MKKLYSLMCAVLIAAGLMTATGVNAQSSVNVWTGNPYTDVVGKTVFLYNVGTGRFIIHGGDWGTQVRLFNSDYGKSMTLQQNDNRYIFKTGVNTGEAAVLGCNVPLITSKHAWKGNYDLETFTLLMDANENYSNEGNVSGQRSWHFVPVEGDTNNTYYMYEELGGGTTTNFYYIQVTSGSTTYYLTVTNNSTVGVTTDASQAQRWTTSGNYNYFSYTSGGTTYYLLRNGSTPTVSTSNSDSWARYSSYYGGVIEDEGNTRYYLKYSNGSVTFAAGNNGSIFTRSSQQTETTGGTKYWLGAAYGENGPLDAASGEGHEGDPVGKICLLSTSFDKAVWSTVDPRTTDEYDCQLKSSETAYLNYDNETNKTVKRSMATAVRVFNANTFVPVSDLYKWRIVTPEQILETLTDEEAGDGLSTNLTWLINDPSFERNDNSFFDNWVTGRVSGVTYDTSTGRHGYTWGYATNKAIQQTSYRSHPWNEPVRLKTEWVHKNNAKYGFLEFEGAGTVSTKIVAPAAGVYRISCYGYYQGTEDHPGYLFATTTIPQGTTAVDPSNFVTANLKKVSGAPYNNASKSNEGTVTRSDAGVYSGSGVMFAGVPFINDYADKNLYRVEVEITLAEGQTVYFGVGKNGATQVTAGSNYPHDSEYVGADQFSIQYLGTSPVWFNEDKTSLTYLDEVNGGQYTNQTVRLHRDFKIGKWNSFVFPMNISAAQVREAFGAQTKLAELDGLGTMSGNASIIDFRTLPLPNEGTAIEKGKLYLIMPELNPLTGKNPENASETLTYYSLGRLTFNTSDFEDTHVVTLEKAGTGAAEHNDAKSLATYVATSDYDSYTPTSTPANGVFVPSGAYVISDGKMYHLNKNTKIKGFRGWIEDVNASPAKNFSLNGVYDQGATNIIGLTDESNVKADGYVYDMSGRKVSANGAKALSKGMYILNGKKFVIK